MAIAQKNLREHTDKFSSPVFYKVTVLKRVNTLGSTSLAQCGPFLQPSKRNYIKAELCFLHQIVNSFESYWANQHRPGALNKGRGSSPEKGKG